ncbi:DUF3961 domain-containing protein [Geobacillus phage GR1]|nr:DUF3961 domain-containing protein [Geobacillus phage GR1]
MERIVQLSSRKNLTLRQKIGILILMTLEVISTVYWKINEYFGIDEHVSDRIWFYGFYGFCITVTLVTLIIVNIPIG